MNKIKLICEKVEWISDDPWNNNNGYTFGIYYYNSRQNHRDGIVFDSEWFLTEKERDEVYEIINEQN